MQYIPPQFRSASAEAQAALASPHGQQAAAFISLQNQLSDTQTSLSGQLDKIRHLEGRLQEHESLKYELATMRESVEESKREMDLYLTGTRGRQMGRGMLDDDDDDDDDARSVSTLMDSDEGEARVRDRRRGDIQRERPRTPEPIMNGNGDDAHDSPGESRRENEELVSGIQTLSNEITEAVQLSRTLQSQHEEAMSAVKLLTERVGELENGITSRVTEAEQRWELWRAKFEEGWKKERESWDAERERLRGVVREWEEASRRAHEEEEERELNERLSGDDSVDEEDEGADGFPEDAEEGEILALGNGWKGDVRPRKPRRRRPSSKAILAVRAFKSAAGGMGEETGLTTPTAGHEIPRLGLHARKRFEKSERELERSGSASTFKGGKEESSESGKESLDTLEEALDVEGDGTRPGKGGRTGRKTKLNTVLQVGFRMSAVSQIGELMT